MRKSSYSGNNGGACIEVAATGHVLVRDTQDREGPVLAFGRQAWEAFLWTGACRGQSPAETPIYQTRYTTDSR
jgi:hypothetical protein